MDNDRLIPRTAPAKRAQPTAGERARAWITNQGLTILVVALFILANCAVFVERYLCKFGGCTLNLSTKSVILIRYGDLSL